MNILKKLKKDDGSILVIALIMLMILSLIGVMSTTTTSIDLQIAGNERVYKQNFNTAEAANRVVIQMAVNMSKADIADGISRNAKPWLSDDTDDIPSGYREGTGLPPFRRIADWEAAVAAGDAIKITNFQGVPGDTYFAALYNGMFPGDELKPQAERRYQFTCYGLYNDPNTPSRGRVIVETGMTRY